MNKYAGIEDEGILKEFYDDSGKESMGSAMSEAIKKRRKKALGEQDKDPQAMVEEELMEQLRWKP